VVLSRPTPPRAPASQGWRSEWGDAIAREVTVSRFTNRGLGMWARPARWQQAQLDQNFSGNCATIPSASASDMCRMCW
jgi:hypothetical protein